MSLPIWTTALVVVAGFLSGVLAAVLGIGGAVITTPFIRFLGATPIAAVGSTVPAILPGAISGSLRYHREGYIVWRTAFLCGGSGMAFAVLGGWVADIVDARWLMVLTALLVLWSGASLLRSGRAATAAATADPDGSADELPADPQPGVSVADRVGSDAVAPPAAQRGGTAAMVGLGVVAGFLAGLLGVGGGLILTPGLTLGLRLPVKHAIATSLAAVAMMSTTALATHIALGHIDWRFAVPLAVGIVPGARVGSRVTVGASEQTMRTSSGALLVLVAMVYLGTELARLV